MGSGIVNNGKKQMNAHFAQPSKVNFNRGNIHKIQVWWECDGNGDAGWAYHVSTRDNDELASGGVYLNPDASLDDVIDLVLHQLAIDGVTHDDFAKSLNDGGSAVWMRGEAETIAWGGACT